MSVPSDPEMPEEGIDQVDDEPRRHPSTLGGMLYLAVLAVTCVGMVVVGFGAWRGGVRLIAGAMIVAGVVRALIRARDAGMLAVRARWIDTALLVVVGAVMWFLAGDIPEI